MAVNNSTEAKAAVTSTLVPTLTLAQHKTLLNDNILNSTVFQKDVIATETPIAGAVTIDYSNKDTATVTTAVDLAVSFSNLENGAVKYLSITKVATNAISFVGATDTSIRKDYITKVSTLVVYRVSNKNGNIYVESINIDNVRPTEQKIVEIGDWDMDTNQAPAVALAHGIGDAEKIRSVSVMVRNDAGTNVLKLDFFAATTGVGQGAIGIISDTTILLTRLTGGYFDQATFSSTSYNRGWVTIEYIN